MEVTSLDVANQTVSVRLILGFSDSLVRHLRFDHRSNRALVPLAKVPRDMWAQMRVNIYLAECIKPIFMNLQSCGIPVTIPLGTLVETGGHRASSSGSAVRETTLPVMGWPSRFPSDVYQLTIQPEVVLPPHIDLDTSAAGGLAYYPVAPTETLLFGDSGLGGHTLTAAEGGMPKELVLGFVIGRPLLYQVTIYVVALLPLLLGFVFWHVSVRQRRPIFDLGVTAGLIATMLAILPLRVVLVPSDFNATGLTLVDYILVLGVLFIAVFLFRQYAKFVTTTQESN
jgi:hypothetical protein